MSPAVRAGSWVPCRRDVVLAAGLGIVAVIEAAGIDRISHGSMLPALAAASMAAGLAFRRSRVVTAALFTLGTFALQELAVGTLSEAVLPFIILLVTMYTAAVGTAGVRLAVIAVASYASVGGSVLLDESGGDLGSGLYAAIVVTLALGVGRIVAARQRTILALADDKELVVRERTASIAAATARERARIARELHDLVTHRVSAMVLQAGTERRALTRNGDDRSSDIVECLETIELLGREAMSELRHLLGALHHGESAPRAPQPGTARLAELVAQTARAGVDVRLHVAGPARPLPPGIDVSIYRIVQEALANAMRHAAGAAASVILTYSADTVGVEITNDAPDASPPSRQGAGLGLGLVGMRERASLFGGSLVAGPRSDGGFSISASFPAAVHVPTEEHAR